MKPIRRRLSADLHRDACQTEQMKYYSTNDRKVRISLEQAVLRGLAEDSGLYMPERIPSVSPDFIRNISRYTFGEISLEIARLFFGGDVPEADLVDIVGMAIDFDVFLFIS